MVAGAAGEGNDGVNTELFCEQDSVNEIVVECLCDCLVRVNGIAVAGQAGNLHIIFFKGCLEFCESRIVVQENLGITMSLARVTAAADFRHGNTHAVQDGQCFVKGLGRIEVGKYAEFHKLLL